NLLVRIWRGTGVGNLPVYSTTALWIGSTWIGSTNGIFALPSRRHASAAAARNAAQRGSARPRQAAQDRGGGSRRGGAGASASEQLMAAGRGGKRAHRMAQAQHARRWGGARTGRGRWRTQR